MPRGYKDLLLKEVKELLKKLPPNVRIRVYYDDMGKSKYTLNGLGSRVDQLDGRMDRLEERMDRLEGRMDSIETKLDQIGDALFEFIKTTNARFDKLEKDFNDKIDRIEQRLDYNNLKQLPNSK